MTEFRTLISLLLLSTLVSCAPGAQEEPTPDGSTEAYADSVLSAAFDRWGYFGTESSVETETLLPGLVAEMLSEPASMKWELDSLHKEPYVTTTYSDDGRIRLLTWLAPGCGTMHRWQSVVCFVDDEGKYHAIGYKAEYDEPDPYSPGAVTSLHYLRDSHYLALGAGQMSGGMPHESADLVVLTADGLNRSAHCFHTLDGTFPGLILDKSWYFDHLEEYEEGAPQMLAYDSATHTLTFPTILDETGTRLFMEVFGIGEGIVVEWTRPIRMRWVDTGFVEM